jgi:BspA type Leucine rich repeat region (6 copies)
MIAAKKRIPISSRFDRPKPMRTEIFNTGTTGPRATTTRLRTAGETRLLALLLLLTSALLVEAQFNYTTNNGTITITGYTGSGGAVSIPDTIDGLPVTTIGYSAFWSYSLTAVTIPNSVTSIGDSAFGKCSLTNVTVGNSVTNIGDYAFADCSSLIGVYFRGNAPNYGEWVLGVFGNKGFRIDPATVYYLPGASGWGPAFAFRPTAVWKPQLQVNDSSFGVGTNGFGFNIAWASGMSVVVEACTNMVNPIWSPLQTNTLSGDTLYFSDPQGTNYPARLYRLRWQ